MKYYYKYELEILGIAVFGLILITGFNFADADISRSQIIENIINRK